MICGCSSSISAALLGGDEEFGQALGLTVGVMPCGIDLHETERLGQPARAVEQPPGLSGHVAFLEVVDEPAPLLALGLAHRFENAGLGDAAEIVTDGRLLTGSHHVERPTARASRSAWPNR